VTAVGDVVRWGDDWANEYQVWSLHPKRGYVWIIRVYDAITRGHPIEARAANLTIVRKGTAVSAYEPQSHARTTDPSTSKQAAARVTTANAMKGVILRAFQDYPKGLTTDQVLSMTGLENGGWKRVSDLLRDGLLVDTGMTRPGRSGRQQRVLKVQNLNEEAS